VQDILAAWRCPLLQYGSFPAPLPPLNFPPLVFSATEPLESESVVKSSKSGRSCELNLSDPKCCCEALGGSLEPHATSPCRQRCVILVVDPPRHDFCTIFLRILQDSALDFFFHVWVAVCLHHLDTEKYPSVIIWLKDMRTHGTQAKWVPYSLL
jgi:hypothetical protein